MHVSVLGLLTDGKLPPTLGLGPLFSSQKELRHPSFRASLGVLALSLGDRNAALEVLEELAENQCQAIPPDLFRPATLSALADICCELETEEFADALYSQILPHAQEQAVMGFAYCSYGSLSTQLGALASLRGDFDLASSHYEFALEQEASLGAEPALAKLRARYAGTLKKRASLADIPKADALLQLSAEAASRLGMLSLSSALKNEH